jgi:uncharacterized membrane protein
VSELKSLEIMLTNLFAIALLSFFLFVGVQVVCGALGILFPVMVAAPTMVCCVIAAATIIASDHLARIAKSLERRERNE